ncbi:carboxyl transferase domain-containing protein [Streptomyces sp. NPDC048045]|uniref:acyl-CoA carboxylase subunit beta n=1 Tax=Streptomyces sp. NPDC048045 TaxID=3154710 RepID=UPI003428A6B7
MTELPTAAPPGPAGTGGEPDGRAALVGNDPRDPLVRLARLLDEGTLTVVHDSDAITTAVASGRVHGVDVIAFCTDARVMGGAVGFEECSRIADAIDLALRENRPVIGLWHSGGARLADGIEAMDGIGRIFSATVRASGRIPQISVVLGAAAGGAAYGPALTDVVIMAPAGRIFVTGPDVVRSVTGEQIDMEGLGGTEAHGRKSGVTHIVACSEADACERARRVTALLAVPGKADLEAVGPARDLRALLPASPRRAYDVRPLVTGLLDSDPGYPDGARGEGGSFEEFHAKWAPNVVTGLGRLAGQTVGVIANNPLRKGGCLDSLSAEKAARFVRLCDSMGVPLLSLIDVPGYLPGVAQEWGGVVRRGAKLLYAFAEAVVPRVSVVTRKSYGGAYIAMNSRSLGATRVFAWPDAEVAVMGAESAVGILHRKALAAAPETEREELRARLVDEQKRLAGGVDRGLALGVIDEVIDPSRTRAAVAEVFAAEPCRRGSHGNIPL